MCTGIVAWVLAAMTAWAPPKPADEARYEAIARDIVRVAFDEDEQPIYESDQPDARAHTALVLASFAEQESGGFRADVDEGKKRSSQGAVCIMQVKVAPEGTPEGWHLSDLANDRVLCLRAALHRMLDSMDACHALKGADRLGMYTHGRCVAPNPLARFRVGRARWYWTRHAPPPNEAACVARVEP